ncbi:MAG: sortase [Dehalococcoidia bacterium]
MRTVRFGMLVALTVAGTLAACGGSDSNATPSPMPTTEVPGTATATPPLAPPTAVPTPTASPVPSGKPVRMVIPSIGTNVPAVPKGLTANRQIEPVMQGEAGYYTPSDPVGKPGNAFWLGNRDGTFGGRMDTIRAGAEIFITTESGGRYVYSVVSLTKFTVAQLDMAKVIAPTLAPGEERLTILTSADLDAQTGADLSYWVVVATRKP